MAAVLVLLLVGWAGTALTWVPMAAIDALLLLVAWSLVDPDQWRELWRVDRREGVAAGTLLATLVLPLEVVVLAGVAASWVPTCTARHTRRCAVWGLWLRRSRVRIVASSCWHRVRPSLPAACCRAWRAGLAAPRRMWRTPCASCVPNAEGALPPGHLLVMGKSMNFIDPAGALWERERRATQRAGSRPLLPSPAARGRPRERSGFLQRLGPGHIFPDKRSAIAAIVPQLDLVICARCRARL